jgi:tRNA (adenine57-N1/adenine58-N1)-methyltransferase catalytic subunit
VKALHAHPEMYTTWSLEILERPWHVTEQSIRPDHRMTGHTGFLVFSRRSARWAVEEGASHESKS